jgi:hypothetical protein
MREHMSPESCASITPNKVAAPTQGAGARRCSLLPWRSRRSGTRRATLRAAPSTAGNAAVYKRKLHHEMRFGWPRSPLSCLQTLRSELCEPADRWRQGL